MADKLKCASVTLVGRPSSGKSTFVNSICESKVSITSPVPQTTRNSIKGIYTDTRGQLIFIDTPGLHNSNQNLNLHLREVSVSAMNDCDVILYMVDACRTPGQEEEMICELLKKSKTPKVVCINKKDIATPEQLEDTRFFLKHNLEEDIPILEGSALEDEGLDEVLIEIFRKAPYGELLYDENSYTDQDLEFRVSEIIREKAMANLKDELPHAIFVELADIEYNEEESKVWIRAFINVEHESQKGIVVGRGGENIKRIRVAAFKDIKRIFPGSRLELDIRVKTLSGWRQNTALLNHMIK